MGKKSTLIIWKTQFGGDSVQFEGEWLIPALKAWMQLKKVPFGDITSMEIMVKEDTQ